MLKGCIFDLWNTLISPGGVKFTERLAKTLDIDDDYVLDYIRSSSSRHKSIHYMTIVQEIWSYRFNSTLPQVKKREIEIQHNDFIKSAVYLSNAKKCLRELRTIGIKSAIVSNATSVSADVVTYLKLEKQVDDIFLSCQAGYLKPDPRALLQVADKWKMDANQICVVGDKLTTDILGAKLANMQAIFYNPDLTLNRNINPVDLLYITSDLGEIPSLFSKNG